jgi:hypothetical protein
MTYSFRIQHTQDDQKVSMYLMITIEEVTSSVQSVPRQSPGPRLKLTPSVILNSNYVNKVRLKLFKIFLCSLYSNHQVHRDFLIMLYNYQHPSIATHFGPFL